MKTFIRALAISLMFIILCGVAYPLAITGLSQVLCPKQANGSIISYKKQPAGSELLGQKFTGNKFFHGRPVGPSNLAPSNPALLKSVSDNVNIFLATHPGIKQEDIPADLMTGSASGLDPHISKQAALIQVPAVAKATGISEERLRKLIDKNTEGRDLGLFGEERVNVLNLNLDVLAG